MAKTRVEEELRDRMRLGKCRTCFLGGLSDDSDGDSFASLLDKVE
jgi:hypothetical protein